MTRAQAAPVYDAEDHAFLETTYAEPLGMIALHGLSGLLQAHPWWKASGCPFDLAATRREARSSRAVTAPGRSAQVRIAVGAESAIVLAHEAAHLLIHRHVPSAPAHGAEFAQADLDVCTIVLGVRGARRLADAFASAGITTAPRLWREPPPDMLSPRGLLGDWLLAHRHHQIASLRDRTR